jgi:uncharacterized oligopeptide transporter (OPT) family protein
VPDLKPFVPHDSTEHELTLKAVLAGIVMAAVFGAANAYLGMKAGQTVAATIPAAVIAIALFRLPFFRGGVLEQNLARTASLRQNALSPHRLKRTDHVPIQPDISCANDKKLERY